MMSSALAPASLRAGASAAAIYTCPMHAQIRQSGPGNCPICGMTLEPVEASAEAEPNHELADMTRRFWVGLLLTSPVFILEMGGHIPGLRLHQLVPPALSTWIQFALSTPVVLWAGFPFFERGWASLVGRHLNMFHPDRAWNGHGISLQPRRHLRARHLSRSIPRHGGKRCRIL